MQYLLQQDYGKTVASADTAATVQVCDASSGRTRLIYPGRVDVVTAIAWSPDGEYVASANTDKTVQIWESTTGRPTLTYRTHRSEVLTVA
jgi:WD40 repeat protein